MYQVGYFFIDVKLAIGSAMPALTQQTQHIL